MVGFYPTPPGRRIPYDRDGSGVIQWNGTVITVFSESQRQLLNDETTSSSGNNRITTGQFVAVIFSAPMDVFGFFHASAHVGAGSHTVKYQYSLDTTTGVDGTWDDTGLSLAGADGSATPDYRTRILTPVSPFLSCMGIRIRCSALTGTATDVTAFHLYGKRSTPSGNWLMLWHPTLDEPLSTSAGFYDLGDIPRGAGPQTISFRVKNASASLTAQSVVVLREALTDGTPTIVSLTELRYNGGAYGPNAAVGNLGPGAISQVVDAKIDITAGAPPGIWAPRLVAAAGAWV